MPTAKTKKSLLAAKRAAAQARVVRVKIDLITAFEEQRRALDPKVVDQLVRAIGRDGLKTPIDLTRIQTGVLRGRYKLTTGAHRLAACEKLGMTSGAVGIRRR